MERYLQLPESLRRLDPNYVPPDKPPSMDPYDEFTNPRKLDTALRLDAIEHFRRYVRDSTSRDPAVQKPTPIPQYDLLLRTPGIPKLSTLQVSTTFLPSILLQALSKTHVVEGGKMATARLKDILSVSYENIKLQLEYNLSSMSDRAQALAALNKDLYLDRIRSMPNEVVNFIDAYYSFKHLVDRMPLGKIPGNTKRPEATERRIRSILKHGTNHVVIRGFDCECWWTNDLCVLRVQSSAYLLPISVVPEIHNKVADHISVLIFAWVSDGTYLEEGSYKKTLRFIEALHGRHGLFPKSFFSVAGALEALGTAITISRHDIWKGIPHTEFLKTTLDSVEADCIAVKEAPLTQESELVQILESSSTPLAAELICLTKISGHPLTSTSAGMEKLHERTTRPRVIKADAVAFTAQSLKLDFLKEYYAVNGSYPPGTSVKVSANGRVAAALKLQREIDDPALDAYGPYQVRDFSDVAISQFEELDYLDNILPYLKDKAASVVRSKAWQRYIQHQKETTGFTAREEKLLLMYVLGDPEEIDHVTFAREFEKYQTPIEDFIEQFVIRLVPKEKELKEKARLFGCMTYKTRAATQIILRFMQRFLRRYSSSQALVVTELELAKKLTAFAKKKNLGAGMRSFTICLDAEGWNNAFTKETVGPPIKETIDAMTGSGLPSRIHEMFEHTLFYARETDQTIWYDGQNGGIEGLLQPLWMVVYEHQLKYALRGCPHQFSAIIKGDDVRVRFEIPSAQVKPGTEEAVIGKLRDDIISGLGEYGHKIKVLDSYYSENVLVFSKKIFIGDIGLPSSYRQIQKAHGENNGILTSIDDLVGSAFSNSHSAAGYGVNCFAPYSVALFWALIHIKGAPEFRNLSRLELLALTLTPSALGGFPIIYLHNMFVRAESDLVSAFTGILLFIREVNSALYSKLARICDFRVSTRDSWSLIIEDPYALKRQAYTSPHATLRNHLKASLKKRARNQAILDLFNDEVDDFKRAFVSMVASGDRIEPKLVNQIYECTPCAQQDRFCQKFTSAKSVVQHIYSMVSGGPEVRNLCRRLNFELKRRNRDIALEFKTHPGTRVGVHPDTYTCPTKLAEDLRNIGWGKPIDGITYPPPQHQVIVFHESEVTSQTVGKTFIFNTTAGHKTSEYLPAPHFWKTGQDSFLGHHTPSGTIAAPLDLDTPDVTVGAIKKLLMLSTLATGDLSDHPGGGAFTFREVILHLLSLFTNQSTDELDSIIHKRKSGTRTHHLAARGFRVGILPNMIKNLLSHVTGQVNTYTELRITGENYRINFLHLYVHVAVLLCVSWFFPGTETPTASFRCTLRPCAECHVPIKEVNTYMTEGELFHLRPQLSEAQRAEVASANEQITQAMADDAREHDVRKVHQDDSLTDHQACQVVAGEFFASSLLNFARMTLSYTILRPTVERLQDHMMMRGKNPRSRDITGSELAKIPPEVYVDVIREAVHEYTFASKELSNLGDVHASYMALDGKVLPWATCVQQLLRHGKLQAVMAEACRSVGLPFSSCANACRDYGAASVFLGKHLATRGLSELPASNRTVLVAEYVKSSTLHLLLQRRRFNRLLWLTQLFPMALIEETCPGFGNWGEHHRVVLSILCLATFPSWAVDDIRKYFADTPCSQEIDLVGEVYGEWYQDESVLNRRTSAETLAVLRRWLSGSSHGWEDLLEYLLDMENGFFFDVSTYPAEEEPLDIRVTVIFRDLSLCYQAVRAMETPTDLDDHGGPEHPPNTLKTPAAWTSALAESKAITFAHLIPQGLLERGPERLDNWATYEAPLSVDFTYLTRPLGFSTTAWQKTHRLLQALGVHKAWKDAPVNIACLADGDGGDSRYCVEEFPQAIVVWNSLNEDLATRVSAPLCARLTGSENDTFTTHPRIRCRTQTLEGGDLTKPHIIRLIKEEVPSYHLVKHDASLPLGDSRVETAEAIWWGVLEVWMDKGEPTSIMIQKVFTDLPETLSRLLTDVRERSKLCHLVTLAESHCGHEAYVVAQYPLKKQLVTRSRSSAPSAVRALVYRVAQDNETRMHAVKDNVVDREIASEAAPPLALRSQIPLKGMVHLPELGLDETDFLNYKRLRSRLAQFVSQAEAKADAAAPEMDDPNQPGETWTHLCHLTYRVVYWSSVLAVFDATGGATLTRLTFTTTPTKTFILTRIEDKIRKITSRPRWAAHGGPFSTADKMTTPIVSPDGIESPALPLQFKDNAQAGIKAGMEILAGIYWLRAQRIRPEEPREQRLWQSWATL